jgi:hypothetical protein
MPTTTSQKSKRKPKQRKQPTKEDIHKQLIALAETPFPSHPVLKSQWLRKANYLLDEYSKEK